MVGFVCVGPYRVPSTYRITLVSLFALLGIGSGVDGVWEVGVGRRKANQSIPVSPITDLTPVLGTKPEAEADLNDCECALSVSTIDPY